jgi:hypothetical protein
VIIDVEIRIDNGDGVNSIIDEVVSKVEIGIVSIIVLVISYIIDSAIGIKVSIVKIGVSLVVVEYEISFYYYLL